MASFFSTILLLIVGISLTYVLTCPTGHCTELWTSMTLNNFNFNSFLQNFFNNPANYAAVGVTFIAGIFSGSLMTAIAAALVVSIITYINPAVNIIYSIFGGNLNPTDPTFYIASALILAMNLTLGFAAIIMFRGLLDL